MQHYTTPENGTGLLDHEVYAGVSYIQRSMMDLVRQGTISLGDAAFLGLLVGVVNYSNLPFCSVSDEDLAEQCGMSLHRLRECLERLEDLNLIKRTQAIVDGVQRRLIHLLPVPCQQKSRK